MTDVFETYVSKRLRGDAWTDFACAAAAAIGGILLLTIAYFAAYTFLSVLLFFLPWSWPNETLQAKVGGGLVVVLAFIESWRSNRKLFEGYTSESSAGGTALSTGLYLLGVGWGPRSLIPLSPASSRNSVRVAADLLCSGPRLLTNAIRLIRRGRARARADFHGCAQVLAMALSNPGRLPFERVRQEHPDLNILDVSEQLSWIKGVVLLSKEPVGITLTDSLRDELTSEVSRDG